MNSEEYTTFHKKVSDIIANCDPFNLVVADLSDDEYDQEATLIIPFLKDCKNEEDVEQVLTKVFADQFDDEPKESKTHYKHISLELWKEFKDSLKNI